MIATASRTLLSCAALLVAGCATAAPPAGPEAVARAWAGVESASAGRWVVAGAKAWPVAEGAPAPGPEAAGHVEVLSRRAAWPLPGGGTLVVEGAPEAAGRISVGVLGFRRAETPAEAARLLGRAIRDGDWALLRSLLPADERAHWTPTDLAEAVRHQDVRAAWSRLADAIATGVPEPTWLEPGRRARLEIGATTLVLVSEADGWKVLDVRPAEPYTPGP